MANPQNQKPPFALRALGAFAATLAVLFALLLAAYALPGGPVREVMLTIGWGAVSRLDLEPATCGDPECTADHGYAGTSSNDDFSVRVSEAGDGAAAVERTLQFAAALSGAIRANTR